jgi:hypothetical protein
MFRLHDRTRRRVCIAAFVLLGAIPSLLVGGWCVNRHLPGCARSEADALAGQLGLAVKLAGVRHLRPGAVLYEGIELVDPDSGRTLFRSRFLEVTREKRIDEQGQRRAALCVIASQPEIEAADVDTAWRWLQRLLERQPGRCETELHFSAAEVTLRTPDRSQTLADVAALLESAPDKTQVQVDFRLAGDETREPAGIRIVRSRGESPPTTHFELATGDGELPCSVLAVAVRELRSLGQRCRFRGQIWADETPHGWDADVSGELADLDLDRLVTDRFPHRLNGIAKATIASARFRRGRLEEGCAALTARDGEVSRSLLEAAIKHLGLTAGAEPVADADRIAYRELAMSVTLDGGGLRLRGRCVSAEPGTILSDGRTRILGEPPQDCQPVAALVQTLVPQRAIQVPATRQTDWFLQHLPISDVVSLPGEERIPTATRVRLNDKWLR